MTSPGDHPPPTDHPAPAPDGAAAAGSVPAQRRLALNEDWAATIVGLLLLVLVLAGLWPGWLVP